MRSVLLRRLAWSTVLGALALPVAAQTVYRCGPDGRSYAQRPCDEGRPVRVEDVRSDAQRRDARDAAAREARIARDLERERVAASSVAAPKPARIAGRGAPAAEPPPPAPVASRPRRKPHRPAEDFRAAVPKPAKKTLAAGG